jgi:predicted naringenin-chalcone synthase
MPKDRSPYREVSDLVVRRLVLEGWVARVVLVLIGCAGQLVNMDQAGWLRLSDGDYAHWAMALAAELTP